MSKPHYYAVFLDIDGVLTSSRVHQTYETDYPLWAKFDPIAVDFFNWIHDTYPVKFVLSSTWRLGIELTDEHAYHWIVSAFHNAGFRGSFHEVWATPNSQDAQRPAEVKEWLWTQIERGNSPTDYIIFDDTKYRFNEELAIKRHIWTDPKNGLLHRHMLDAKSMMGTWAKRSSG